MRHIPTIPNTLPDAYYAVDEERRPAEEICLTLEDMAELCENFGLAIGYMLIRDDVTDSSAFAAYHRWCPRGI